MFGRSHDREPQIVIKSTPIIIGGKTILELNIGGKPLDQFPNGRVEVQFQHVEWGQSGFKGHALSDSQHDSRYGPHTVRPEQISPSMVMVTTANEQCHNCKNINGRILEGEDINGSLLRGKAR